MRSEVGVKPRTRDCGWVIVLFRSKNEFLFSGFMQENPDGLLRKEKMFDMYHEVLSETKAKMFVDQIFSKEKFKWMDRKKIHQNYFFKISSNSKMFEL